MQDEKEVEPIVSTKKPGAAFSQVMPPLEGWYFLGKHARRKRQHRCVVVWSERGQSRSAGSASGYQPDRTFVTVCCTGVVGKASARALAACGGSWLIIVITGQAVPAVRYAVVKDGQGRLIIVVGSSWAIRAVGRSGAGETTFIPKRSRQGM